MMLYEQSFFRLSDHFGYNVANRKRNEKIWCKCPLQEPKCLFCTVKIRFCFKKYKNIPYLKEKYVQIIVTHDYFQEYRSIFLNLKSTSINISAAILARKQEIHLCQGHYVT